MTSGRIHLTSRSLASQTFREALWATVLSPSSTSSRRLNSITSTGSSTKTKTSSPPRHRSNSINLRICVRKPLHLSRKPQPPSLSTAQADALTQRNSPPPHPKRRPSWTSPRSKSSRLRVTITRTLEQQTQTPRSSRDNYGLLPPVSSSSK